MQMQKVRVIMDATGIKRLEPAGSLMLVKPHTSYTSLVAEPLNAGFGTTLGNSLRRVLLSSLPGAAVTSVRIEEVEHEFSTIPGMKEDTPEFLLNPKELRLRAAGRRAAAGVIGRFLDRRRRPGRLRLRRRHRHRHLGRSCRRRSGRSDRG